MSEWQPIETMSRSGRQFLVIDACNRYAVLNWPRGCEIGTWERIGGKWYGSASSFVATHYMPLPAPPKLSTNP